LALVVLATTAVAAGCGGSDPEAEPTKMSDSSPPPASAEQAREGSGPEGRTPVGDGRGGVELTELGAFDYPVHVAQPRTGDDGHLYVVEQCGRIQRIPSDGGDPKLFLDVSEQIACGGEQGLLSVAFAPDYADSGLLYVYYTDTEGDERIVEYRRAPGEPPTADPDSARELLAIEDFASNHNGGLLLFGPDDRLYAGTGDGGGSGDPERTAQDPDSPLGKLLRIDTDDGDTEIAALGLRNPWRYSFDRKTGDLWIGDVGQGAWEEIDVQPARSDGGENYGWDRLEGSHPFEGAAPQGAVGPVYEYSHEEGGCTVTGGYVYRGSAIPDLYGAYVFGDYCLGRLEAIRVVRGRVVQHRELGPVIEGLSSFGEDARGELYAMSLAGGVYRIVRRS
jgi:glucose/arabinose dehydrogenase